MAEEPPETDERPLPPRGKRNPPTIDLSAEEVGREGEGNAAGGFAEANAEARTEESVESADARVGAGASVPGAAGFVSLLAAALAGGIIVAVIVLLLARGGLLVPERNVGQQDLANEVAALKSELAAVRQGASDGVAPLQAEIAGVKQSVADLASRAPAAGPDASQIAGIEQRVTALAGDIETLKSNAPADSTAANAALADLRQRVDALGAELQETPGKDQLAALQSRLDEVARKIDAAAALAPAVAADALVAALDAGRPFTSELAALRTLGVDAAAVDALAPHAGTGLPSYAKLRSEFETAIASVDLSSPIPEGSGIAERLLRSAEGLVSVRPAHPTAGSDPQAVVARIRGALDADDLKAALAERDALPAPAKDATAAWAADAQARSAADDLVARLRADALSALKTGE